MDLQKAFEAFFNTNELTSSDQIDLYFNNFVSAFRTCHNKYAPLKRALRKKRKLMFKPWITKGIFVSICKKQKLYITYYLKSNKIQKKFDKTYANKLTKLKTLSKKLYWESEILNSKQDMQKFWNIMKTLPEKPHSNEPDHIENENGAIVTEPNEIAENFNKPFCSIGKKLTARNICSQSNNFRNYLTNSVHSSMYLRPTYLFGILGVIKQLNCNKSCGLEGMDAKFVQLAAEAIAPAQCLLFKACFQNGCFPT